VGAAGAGLGPLPAPGVAARGAGVVKVATRGFSPQTVQATVVTVKPCGT